MRRHTMFPAWALGAGLALCLLMLCSMSALAQGRRPGGGPGGLQLSPEKQQKIWELEAKFIAADLKLPPELTTKLVDAYTAARKSQAEAVKAKMEQGGDRRDLSGMMEIAKAERAKFETAVKAFLTPEQTAKAALTLGSLSRQWDRLSDALDGLGLDDKTKAAGMKLLADYAAESDKAMQAAGNDREGMREKNRALKEKLDADMGKVLSPEQLTKWTEATAMRGGRGRGQGGPGAAGTPPPPAAK